MLTCYTPSGLDHLHLLTSSGPYELRVDLEAFNGTRAFAAYSGFKIGDNGSNYTLYFDAFLGGNAGEKISLVTDIFLKDDG